MKWDAGSDRTRLNTGVDVVCNICTGSEVERRDKGFAVPISEGSDPSLALRHQSYMVKIQATQTYDFNYASQFNQTQTTQLYRVYTEFDEIYTGYDATKDEFGIESPGSAEIMDYFLSITPPATFIFPLHEATNTYLITLNVFNYLDNVTNIRMWITKRAFPVVTDFTKIVGQ